MVKLRQLGILVLVTGMGGLLYLAFLSINYDLNGIVEMSAIERGGAALFPPNHMLYRPIVWGVHRVLQGCGYLGSAILTAQIITAFSGAMGLGLFYQWLRRFLESNMVAVLSTIGFGTSWAYWVYSTDVSYIVPASTVAIGTLALAAAGSRSSDARDAPLTLIGLGLLSGLAVLLWQANICLLPTIVIILLTERGGDRHRRYRAVLGYLVTVAGLVGLIYLIVGAVVLEIRSVPGFIEWLTRYGGADLPMWGQWSFRRVLDAGKTWVASIIPLSQGLGLRAVAQGQFSVEKLLPQASLVSLTVLLLFTVIDVAKQDALKWRSKLLSGLLLGCVPYLVFIVWWEPFEPKWFIVPNAGLWTAVALLWDRRRLRRGLVLLLLVLVIAASTFTATVWPRHIASNKMLDRARCVAEHMGNDDLYVALDWKWSGYLTYFFDRQVLLVLDASAKCENKEELLNLVEHRRQITQQQGGTVYMMDIGTYSSDHLEWLAAQTGLQDADLQRLEREPGFECEGTRFQKLRQVY